MCEPYRFPEPWSFLPEHPDVRRLPEDLEKVLTQRFTSQSLVTAGVFQKREKGRAGLRPELCDRATPVVVLRDASSGEVLDLLARGGSVFQEELPIFTARRGKFVRWGTRVKGEILVVAGCIEDAALLTACGLPATLATGMDRMG